ncbi:hypothetical protein HDU97_009487 [Phlyctochytrium planicorne]|nr:hypothetical protein HDU97_009487 [Phlyctochytrium planicorne]
MEHILTEIKPDIATLQEVDGTVWTQSMQMEIKEAGYDYNITPEEANYQLLTSKTPLNSDQFNSLRPGEYELETMDRSDIEEKMSVEEMHTGVIKISSRPHQGELQAIGKASRLLRFTARGRER